MEIGLSLGSNLGNRLEHLRQAKAIISGIKDVTAVKSSSVYETDPVGVSVEYSQITFLNAVLIASVNFSLESLFDSLIVIEKKMGRRRGNDRNAPRPIDIDIIFAGDAVIRTASLEIPHPRWALRRFVVQPLAELNPDLRIPGENRTVQEVLLALPTEPKVILFSSQW